MQTSRMVPSVMVLHFTSRENPRIPLALLGPRRGTHIISVSSALQLLAFAWLHGVHVLPLADHFRIELAICTLKGMTMCR